MSEVEGTTSEMEKQSGWVLEEVTWQAGFWPRSERMLEQGKMESFLPWPPTLKGKSQDGAQVSEI